jgi:hypothetical protein
MLVDMNFVVACMVVSSRFFSGRLPIMRLHSERIVNLSVMMQTLPPSGEPPAVRWLKLLAEIVSKLHLQKIQLCRYL